MLQKFLIEEYIGGQNGVDNSAIDGLFIDDGWSSGNPSEEDSHAVVDMGLSPTEVHKQVMGWRANQAAAQKKILASKAFNWQLLNCNYMPNETHTSAPLPCRRRELACLITRCAGAQGRHRPHRAATRRTRRRTAQRGCGRQAATRSPREGSRR